MTTNHHHQRSSVEREREREREREKRKREREKIIMNVGISAATTTCKVTSPLERNKCTGENEDELQQQQQKKKQCLSDESTLEVRRRRDSRATTSTWCSRDSRDSRDDDVSTGVMTKSSGSTSSSKMRLVACSGVDCEVMEMKKDDGAIYLPPFAKSSVKFEWLEPPRSVLVVIKPGDPRTQQALVELAGVLTSHYDIAVHVEAAVHESTQGRFERWSSGTAVDFVVTLGGDGTVLWASSLFPDGVPPVLSFAMGTLGFLTCFPFSSHERLLQKMVQGNQFLSLRKRLQCKLYSHEEEKRRSATSGSTKNGGTKGGERSAEEELEGTYVALNEVSVNRGPSSNLVDIDLFCDGIPVTKVQADGVLVSTPTGSTAYSLSAGGSLVHPAVSAMQLTPICPHSLSFRPLLFPDSSTLRLQIPRRNGGGDGGSCMISFDGKHKFEMGPGDCVTIQMSPHPLASVVSKTDTEDWFQSLNGGLHWNMPNEEKFKI